MRRLIASLTTSALLLPQLAGAAAPTTLNDLTTLLREQEGPYTFSAEMHAHVPGLFYVSAWLKGDSQKTGPVSSKGNLKMTVDFADGNTTGRVRGRLLMDGTTLYMILDGMEGTFPKEVEEVRSTAPVGQWFKMTVPGSESDLQEQLQMQTDLLSGLEELLDISRTETGSDTEYVVNLKPEAQTQLAAFVRMMSSALQEELKKQKLGTAASLPNTMPTVAVKARLKLNANNALTFFRQYIAVEDMPVLRFALQSEQAVSATPVTVEVPEGAIDLSDPLLSNDLTATPTDDADCSATGAAKLALIRKGICPAERPSRR